MLQSNGTTLAPTWVTPSTSSGTVTTVSVATANGFSGTVANATTTPAITIVAGAITPSSVNGNTFTTGTGTLTLSTFTLTVAGTASISGTNTGDNTVATALTGTPSITVATVTTTGAIELGNASDTTLSRSSAGVLAVEGVVIPSITSTNTLTNKTMTGATNTLTASLLKSATTEVSVSAATAPTNGQVLTATGASAATWQTPTAVSTDGWTASADTWTFASATSFTIAGVDRTTTFTKGTRLKFTNNSLTVYATVASSSFSTNTTVNVIVNTDFTIANSAITNPFYSYQVNPSGYPTVFNFADGITGFSANPANRIAFFTVVGNICTLHIVQNSPGTSNAAGFGITAPVTAIGTTNYFPRVAALVLDTSVPLIGDAVISSGSTAVTIEKVWGSGGGFTATGNKAANFIIAFEF